MKKQFQFTWKWMHIIFRVCVMIGLALAGLGAARPVNAETTDIVPRLDWNTFFGGAGQTIPLDMAVDASGNIYVVGLSEGSWGNPVRPFEGSYSLFAARLDAAGNLIWNTFLGPTTSDTVVEIALDAAGDVYVVGESVATWGDPLTEFHGTANSDGFLARLNGDGALLWHTFIGSSLSDVAWALAVGADEAIYVGGISDGAWGSPIHAYAGGADGWLARFDADGALQWNTFVGGTGDDSLRAIAISGNETLNAVGTSNAAWGDPVDDYTGEEDVFAAAFSLDGARQWNTFMGSGESENAADLAVDRAGNLVVMGSGRTLWGTPLVNSNFRTDLFLAKLNASGERIWNTFSGFIASMLAFDLAVDADGNISVLATTDGASGTKPPLNSFVGMMDAQVLRYNGDGGLLWHTYLGSASIDMGTALAIDANSNVVVGGFSETTWGNPVQPFIHDGQGFVARIQMPSRTYLPLLVR